MTRFLCIRHAESEMNAAGRWQGQADSPLSARGEAQARALAERLAAGEGQGLAALVTSDLARARATAAALGARLGLAAEPCVGLRERDVGAWSGRTHEDIAARWPEDYARFRAGDEHVRPGGGESRAMLRARVEGALAGLAERFPGVAIALVTHLGVLRVLRPGLVLANAEPLWLPAASLALPRHAAAADAWREAGDAL